jgi:hypothetical protein
MVRGCLLLSRAGERAIDGVCIVNVVVYESGAELSMELSTLIRYSDIMDRSLALAQFSVDVRACKIACLQSCSSIGRNFHHG